MILFVGPALHAVGRGISASAAGPRPWPVPVATQRTDFRSCQSDSSSPHLAFWSRRWQKYNGYVLQTNTFCDSFIFKKRCVVALTGLDASSIRRLCNKRAAAWIWHNWNILSLWEWRASFRIPE